MAIGMMEESKKETTLEYLSVTTPDKAERNEKDPLLAQADNARSGKNQSQEGLELPTRPFIWQTLWHTISSALLVL